MRPHSTLARALVALSLAGLAGCATNVDPVGDTEDPLVEPRLEALNTYRASVGDVIEALGADFAADADHYLVWEGSFDAADGMSDPVSLREPVRRVDGGMVEWTRFGPHAMPFSPRGARVGTFYGTIRLEAEHAVGDDTVTLSSDPLDVVFDVEPSIIVREFQPITGSCAQPATLALGEVPYRLGVEAIGIEPAQFSYTISTPQIDDIEPIVERHLVEGRFDEIGARGDLILPAVPADRQAYGLVVTIEATSADGQRVHTSFAVEVHRPIEVFYNGNVQIAEILPPQPVSACMPGGESGRMVTYNETQVETRSRSYNVGWDESWRSTHTVAEGSSDTVGASTTNGVGYGVSMGNSVTWQVGTEVSGTFSLGEAVKLGVSGSVSRAETNSRTESTNRNRTDGLSESTTTTNTESNSEEIGGSSSEGFEWEVSSSESIARGFGGTVIAQRFGVFYRQAMRLVRRGALVTYNQCGAPEMVGEVDFVDWTWAADLAQAGECPPLPPSNLPQAECFIEPCSE